MPLDTALGSAAADLVGQCVSPDLGDLAIVPEGLVVTIQTGKTDQTRQGRIIGIPYGKNPLTCPVKATLGWIEKANLTDGRLFRSVNKHGHVAMTGLTDQVVALIIKIYAKKSWKAVLSF